MAASLHVRAQLDRVKNLKEMAEDLSHFVAL